MIADTPVAAPAAAPPSPDDLDAEEDEGKPIGIYLVDEATAASRTKDAATAAMAAWIARRAQLRNALDMVGKLRLLPINYLTAYEQAQRFRDTFRVRVDTRGDLLDNVESSIANELEESPLHLAVVAGELDAVLRLEKTARKEAGLSEADKVTSFLASTSALLAAPEMLRRRIRPTAAEVQRQRVDGQSRVDLLEHEVREAGISFDHGLDGLALALQERLAREPASVRAEAAWTRAEVQLPRNDTAANAQLAEAMAQASLGHLKTRQAIDDDDVAVFVPWDDEAEHQEALDEWGGWTLEGPSDLATVGRTTRRGHDGTDLGLQYDYRVPVGAFVAPTADSWPRRPSGAPTVVQPASALARVKSLHGLVDGIVLGERCTAWMRSEASS